MHVYLFLNICQSVFLWICLSVYLFVYRLCMVYFCWYVCAVYLFIYLSFCLFIILLMLLRVNLYICLSVSQCLNIAYLALATLSILKEKIHLLIVLSLKDVFVYLWSYIHFDIFKIYNCSLIDLFLITMAIF